MTSVPPPPPPSGPRPRLTVAFVRDRYASFMERLLFRLGVRGADIEDVMQEVLCVVARHLGSFTLHEGMPIDAAMRMWLRCICLHKALEHRRTARMHAGVFPFAETDSLPGGAPGPDALLEQREELREVLSLVEALEPGKRAVVLACLAGQSVAEVARELGIPEGTAWTRLRSAKIELERAMDRRRKRDRSGALPCWLAALERALSERPAGAGPGVARREAGSLRALAACPMIFAVFFACLDVPPSARGPAEPAAESTAVPGAMASVAADPPAPPPVPRPAPPEAPSTSTSVLAAEAPAPAADAPPPPAQTRPLGARTRPANAAPRKREHREERAFLAKAQEALAAGRLDAAAAALEMHRRRFPDSALADVRERLEAKVRAP